MEVRRPGQAPIFLTAANAAGFTLPAGTEVRVSAGSSVTVRFPDGDVALRENTQFSVITPRFFLLVPSFFPLRGSFARIVWRYIPGVEGCATLATPNTRLAFLPPIPAPPGIPRVLDRRGRFAPLADGDVTFSVTYTQVGGLGTSVVNLEAGTLNVEDLRGGTVSMAAGETQTFTSFAAGSGAMNLNGDTAPDVFTYNPTSGAWTMALALELPSSTGTWSRDWTVRPADFDGNGLTDFLLYNTTSGQGVKAVNDGQGTFTESSSTWSPGRRPFVVNLNGDRRSDIFLHHAASGQWLTGISNASGDFQYTNGQWSAGMDAYPTKLNDVRELHGGRGSLGPRVDNPDVAQSDPGRDHQLRLVIGD